MILQRQVCMLYSNNVYLHTVYQILGIHKVALKPIIISNMINKIGNLCTEYQIFCMWKES